MSDAYSAYYERMGEARQKTDKTLEGFKSIKNNKLYN